MIWNKLKYLNFEDVKGIKQYYESKINLMGVEKVQCLEKNIELKNENIILKDKNSELFQNQEELREEIESIKETIIEQNCSEIDDYLSKKYKVIPDKIYTDKRSIKGIPLPIRLNDMIQPEVYAVEQYLENFKFNSNGFQNIKLVSNDIASWEYVSDKFEWNKEDYYLFVSEILALKKADCEKMSYVLASCFPKLVGVLYCVSTYASDKPYGHAVPVFLYDNELYIADSWYGDKSFIERLDYAKYMYEGYFIITKRATYFIKNGEFGKKLNN